MMRATRMMTLALVVVMLGGLALSSGCQPWEKRYAVCQANLENLQALFERCQDDVSGSGTQEEQLAQQLAQLQSELQLARDQLQQKETFTHGFTGEDVTIDVDRGTITVPIGSDVLFDAGKVTLKKASKGRLKKIADVIFSDYPDKEVWVVGYTDTDPIKKSGWKDNWELSAERALAVARYLISQKVPAEQLAVVGRGEFHPIGKSKTASRRVEIVVNMYKARQ